MEMKRYRETKEKLRRRKEEARRKKAMAVEVSASTSADLPRSGEDKNNDDDEEEDDATTGILDADDVDIEKTTKKTIVDELEILRKSKPRKHSNVYEEWKKQELKMKMEKRRSAGKGSSKMAKRAKISESVGALDYNSEEARKIKDKFRVAIASVIVQHLGPYRKDTCEIGKITNNEDFKHLARKVRRRMSVGCEQVLMSFLVFPVDPLCDAEGAEAQPQHHPRFGGDRIGEDEGARVHQEVHGQVW
jgi:[histone H3]-lysine36 N-trimethyltransferase